MGCFVRPALLKPQGAVKDEAGMYLLIRVARLCMLFVAMIVAGELGKEDIATAMLWSAALLRGYTGY